MHAAVMQLLQLHDDNCSPGSATMSIFRTDAFTCDWCGVACHVVLHLPLLNTSDFIHIRQQLCVEILQPSVA